MGKTACASEFALEYLSKFSDKKLCVLGLILGQTSSVQDDIVHLAKTPDEKPDNDILCEESSFELLAIDEEFFQNVSETWIADHANHVTRMLPGGVYVLGIFATTSTDIFKNPTIMGKMKNVLLCINKTLSSNKYMYGCPTESTDRLIINYNTETKSVSAKSVDLGKLPSLQYKDVDLKFNSMPLNWFQLECYYEFDEIYPVVVQKTGISIKEQFQQILDAVYKSVDTCVVFLDGCLKNESLSLESQFKRKTKKQNVILKENNEEEPQAIQVSMYMPCEYKMSDSVEYLECEGTSHFSGIVASRVFVNSKSTVKSAIAAIKQDIIRSLTARFTMHCDALIDDNLLPEEKVCFNEPPRRVLISLPEDKSGNVFLCDYLFPGESPIEALVSVKEMLDANITVNDVISNVETPADTSEFDALDKYPSSEEMSVAPPNSSKFSNALIIGISSLLVIIGALIIQIVFF